MPAVRVHMADGVAGGRTPGRRLTEGPGPSMAETSGLMWLRRTLRVTGFDLLGDREGSLALHILQIWR